MQPNEACALGRRRDEEIRQADRSMLSFLCELRDDLLRAQEIFLRHRYARVRGGTSAPCADQALLAPCAIENLELDHAAGRDFASQDQRLQLRRDLWDAHVDKGALVGEIRRHQRQAFSITAGLSRSRPSMVFSWAMLDLLAAPARTSSKERSTVSRSVTVPRILLTASNLPSSISRVVVRVPPLGGCAGLSSARTRSVPIGAEGSSNLTHSPSAFFVRKRSGIRLWILNHTHESFGSPFTKCARARPASASDSYCLPVCTSRMGFTIRFAIRVPPNSVSRPATVGVEEAIYDIGWTVNSRGNSKTYTSMPTPEGDSRSCRAPRSAAAVRSRRLPRALDARVDARVGARVDEDPALSEDPVGLPKGIDHAPSCHSSEHPRKDHDIEGARRQRQLLCGADAEPHVMRSQRPRLRARARDGVRVGIHADDRRGQARGAEREPAVAAAHIEHSLAPQERSGSVRAELTFRKRPHAASEARQEPTDLGARAHPYPSFDPGSMAGVRAVVAARRAGSMSGERMSSGGSAPGDHQATSRVARN